MVSRPKYLKKYLDESTGNGKLLSGRIESKCSYNYFVRSPVGSQLL